MGHVHVSAGNLRLAFLLNLGIIVVEVVGGIMANSLATVRLCGTGAGFERTRGAGVAGRPGGRGCLKRVHMPLLFFVFAGLAEIGGGYLVWLYLREDKPLWYGLLGGVVLIIYGVIPTFQPEANFGRVYAAYGGIFIVLSLLWGWQVDKKTPDLYDWIGAMVCLVGVAVIMWAPRR